MRWLLHPGQWLNRVLYCSYWECEPVQNGTWWRARSGAIVTLDPDLELKCAKCGEPIGV